MSRLGLFCTALALFLGACTSTRANLAGNLTSTTVRPTDRVVIAQAVSEREARLPCNRAGAAACGLRIYQINVSTFVDGNHTNNGGEGYGPGPHTGDLRGIIQSLDYISSLGFNTIWLTPIFDSRAGSPQQRLSGAPVVNRRLDGTGYFAKDYFNIDPHFGTMADARELVSAAHARGLKVVFDGVFGHHKGGVVASPSGLVPVDILDPKRYPGDARAYPGRIVDFSDPRSIAFFEEVATFWIEQLGIDGWRLDQVYQIPAPALRSISVAIQAASAKANHKAYIVGEMWGDAQAIADVLGPEQALALMSAFDFPARYALTQVLASDENGTSARPSTTINAPWAMGAHKSYPEHAILNLMLGNHDLVRFGDLVQRAGLGTPKQQVYWDRHLMAFTFMAAWSGPITLYYGEEIGAEVPDFSEQVKTDCSARQQCDDHISRTMFALPMADSDPKQFDPMALTLKGQLTHLMTLRKAIPALYEGNRTHLYSDRNLYLDLKSLGQERYVLVMNVSGRPQAFGLTKDAVDLVALSTIEILSGNLTVNLEGGMAEIEIPAHTAAIFRLVGAAKEVSP